MRFASACVAGVVAIVLVEPCQALGQSIPSVLRRGNPQPTAEQAPPVPTVMRPAEGEVVVGDLVIAVQVPPQVPARRYTIEAAYWDPGRNDWAYPGTFGEDFSGGTTATTRVGEGLRLKWNQKATRWKIHVRTFDPPGSWGPWREFGWQAAPAIDRTAPAATPPPAATPTNTATTTGEGGKPGMMVPGTTASQPGQTDTRTAPPTPPGTNVPAVQQPPTQTIPNPGLPDTRTAPPTPPSTNVPAVQQPPTQTVPNLGPPDTRTAPPATSLPAVQQPPQQLPPPVQQPPVQVPPAVVTTPPPPIPPSPQQPPAPPPSPRTAPTIPNITSRLPVRLPANAAPGATTKAPPSQSPTLPAGNPVNVASQTKLEVWDGKPMPASQQHVYVPGPVDVDWEKKPLQWWFQASTTAPAAAPGKFRWEMSRTPFPDFGAWQPTPGYGYTGLAGGVRFYIVLDDYAPRPPDWPVAAFVSAQPAPTVVQPGAGAKGGGGSAPPALSQRLGLPDDLLIPRSTGHGGLDRSATPALTLPASLSLYIRVVPLDKAGNDAGLPSNGVELRFGPARKAPPFDMNPKYLPVVTFVSYRPVQGYAFDWQCWVKASKDIKVPDFMNVGVDPGTTNNTGVLYHKGDTWNSCKHDDGNAVDDFVDAVGGFIDILGKFVTWVSNAYASIKNAVVSQVINVIPGCSTDPKCQFAVKAGLNAGLAAVGMPPELPDFEQLQAMGEGYLVDAIAQQVASQTNLPFAEDAARAALKEFIEKGKEAMQGGTGSSPWIPDDSKQYKSLFLTLAVTNPASANATPAMYLEVREPGGSRYSPITVAIPALPPGQSVKVSVALKPLKDPKAWMELLPTAEEYLKAYSLMGSSGEQKVVQTKTEQADAALKDWRAQYLTGVVNFQATLKLPPFVAKVAYETSCFANKQGCLVQ